MDLSVFNKLIDPITNFKLTMAINERDFPKINKKKGKDMYHSIEEIYTPDMLEKINVNYDIIIAAPTGYKNIRRNRFGDLNITTDKKLDISNCQVVHDHAVLNFFPKIKILIPKGINLTFNPPVGSNYIWKYYQDHTILHRYITSKDIPDYHIYTKLTFVIYIDIKRMRKMKNLLTINKDKSIINMNFTPKYFIGDPEFTSLNNVYFIRNDELIKTFDDLY